MTASAWTDDRIGRLKTLWLEGQTAEQIARDLANGITRSAVLGKVHRMGLSAGRSGRPPKRPAAGPKPPRLAPARSLADRPIDARPVVASEHGLATVLSVRRCQCRWPFGEPGAADFSLCGQPVTRDRRDYIETVFFRRVDQDASDIFDLLELPGPVVLNKSHNDGLSRFVMSLLQRDPIRVAELQVLAQRTYTEVISQSRDLYEERRGADDPSFDEYRAAFDGPSAQILGGHLIPKLSDLPKLGAHLNGMTRRLITLVSPRHQLLTCDRPLVTYNGFGRSDAYVVLPVGPSRLLAWTNSPDYMDLLEEAFRGCAAVPALNRKIVAQAARFVYATSAGPLRFVTNHWPETPSDPFPGLGEFL